MTFAELTVGDRFIVNDMLFEKIDPVPHGRGRNPRLYNARNLSAGTLARFGDRSLIYHPVKESSWKKP